MNFSEIKSVLSVIENPVEKLEMVMDLGKLLEPVPQGGQCTEIAGCASRVEICVLGNRFFAVADSALVRGIVAILISMVDGKTPQEIKQMDIAGEFAALNINLGAGRLNGLNSMIRFLQNL